MIFSTHRFATYAAILRFVLTFPISSGVALGQGTLGQGGASGQGNPGYSGTPSSVNADTIDDATLKQTAKAYVKVRQIVQTAERDINNTTNSDQQRQIAKQAESKKMAAVKAEGLRPQQYNQVIQLARDDKAFQQKFLSYVNQVKKSPS